MNDDELLISMGVLLLAFTLLALGTMYAVAVLR